MGYMKADVLVLIIAETVPDVHNEDWDLLEEERGVEAWVADGWERGLRELRDEPVLRDVDLIIVDSRLSGIEANYDWVRQQIREKAIASGQLNLFLMETFTGQLDLFAAYGLARNSTWENLPKRIPSLILQHCTTQ